MNHDDDDDRMTCAGKSASADNDTNADERAQFRRAARFLDAEAHAVNAETRIALADARTAAAAAHRHQWFALRGWGGAGLGLALAASLSAVLVLPTNPARAPMADAALAALMQPTADDFRELALADDTETALADEMAFIAWLEENHDAG